MDNNWISIASMQYSKYDIQYNVHVELAAHQYEVDCSVIGSCWAVTLYMYNDRQHIHCLPLCRDGAGVDGELEYAGDHLSKIFRQFFEVRQDAV